jgi:hypothetical protein
MLYISDSPATVLYSGTLKSGTKAAKGAKAEYRFGITGSPHTSLYLDRDSILEAFETLAFDVGFDGYELVSDSLREKFEMPA